MVLDFGIRDVFNCRLSYMKHNRPTASVMQPVMTRQDKQPCLFLFQSTDRVLHGVIQDCKLKDFITSELNTELISL